MRKILSVLLAFLLTGTLVFFGVTLIAHQVIAPALNEEGAPVSDAFIREEKEMIRERVNAFAEIFGFSPEPVIAAIDDEILQDLNRQASLWWSSLLRDGKPGKEIGWSTKELERILASDPSVADDEDKADEMASAAAGEIRESVIRMVLPMRQQVIRLGMKKLGKRVNLPSLIHFLTGLPWAAAMLCVLLAGLIALIRSRRIRDSLPYIGSAMGAAALVMICITVLYLSAGIQPMIREASDSLTIQYQGIMTGALVRVGVFAVLMAAACVLCLKTGRKGGKTA